MVTAEGGTGYTHAMTIARSKTLDGPYEVAPQGYLLTAKDNQHLPVQRSGHGDLVETATGETYLVHLCGRPLTGELRCPMGRETGLQKTAWTEDGWLRVEGATANGLPALHVPAPNFPAHPWPKIDTRHEFDNNELPIDFQWLRTPFPENFMSLS